MLSRKSPVLYITYLDTMYKLLIDGTFHDYNEPQFEKSHIKVHN